MLIYHNVVIYIVWFDYFNVRWFDWDSGTFGNEEDDTKQEGMGCMMGYGEAQWCLCMHSVSEERKG